MEPTTDLIHITELITQQNELVAGLYTNSLYFIGVSGALLVLFLLYYLIKKFY